MPLGIVIVDHGSRLAESNQMLERVAAMFAKRFGHAYSIVEAAHMELAEPSIATAFARCVTRGATNIAVCPFFLGPGKHWTQDIPRLTLEAAAEFPAVGYHVAPTLGVDELILDLLEKRVQGCVENLMSCDLCEGTPRCGRPPAPASSPV